MCRRRARKEEEEEEEEDGCEEGPFGAQNPSRNLHTISANTPVRMMSVCAAASHCKRSFGKRLLMTAGRDANGDDDRRCFQWKNFGN